MCWRKPERVAVKQRLMDCLPFKGSWSPKRYAFSRCSGLVTNTLIIDCLTIAARSREQDPVSDTGTYQRVGPTSDNILQERDEILRGFSEYRQCCRELECDVSQVVRVESLM